MDSKGIEKIEHITELLNSILAEMKFGAITLVVQDGKVVQVEHLEKLRLK